MRALAQFPTPAIAILILSISETPRQKGRFYFFARRHPYNILVFFVKYLPCPQIHHLNGDKVELLRWGGFLAVRPPHVQLTKGRFHRDDRTNLFFKREGGSPRLFLDIEPLSGCHGAILYQKPYLPVILVKTASAINSLSRRGRQ